MSKLSRRKFIFTAGATAAGTFLVHGCSQTSSQSNTSESASNITPQATPVANLSPEETPEVTTAKLGFIALTDSAPLIIALEKGLFAKYGMTEAFH
jgi:nitrate/nitrite transport system substrate-binding protein